MELEQWLSSRLRVSDVSSEVQSDWKNYFGFLVEEFSRMIRAFGLPGILSTGDRHRQCDHAKLDRQRGDFGMYKLREFVHYKYK